MKPAITSKAQMYQLLKNGQLGNTIPQFLSVEEWLASPDSKKYEWWGVRSGSVASHPAARLNCPSNEVAEYAQRHFPTSPNISMMVDKLANVTAWLEIAIMGTGLVVEGIENPDTKNGWTWRNSMPDPKRRKHWAGNKARYILKHYLNENSLDDLEILLEEYTDHIVELSALDRCLGTCQHRNAVIWEVRNY